MAAAPKSLGKKVSSYTVGDNNIVIYDKAAVERYEEDNRCESDMCIMVDASGAEIERIYFPFNVESTAG